jgi:hypothetical protein
MMTRVVGAVVAMLVVILLILPFARDGYRRFEITRQLDDVMDATDKAALKNWDGDSASFARSLYDRCLRSAAPGGTADCDRYHVD